MTKPRISFPDFSGSTAKELGFVRPQKLPPKKVVEEPSGISSSANIAALQTTSTATNSAARTKLRKWSMHEVRYLFSEYICFIVNSFMLIYRYCSLLVLQNTAMNIT